MHHDLLGDPGLPVASPSVSEWQKPPCESFCAPVDPPAQRDVVIIGSGITGCSVAWHLLHHSNALNVAVLDARGICSGATGRNGGRINCTAIHDFDKYSKIFGRVMAARIVRFELAHYQSIFEVVEQIGPHLLDRSELRWINAVNAVFDAEQVEELRRMLVSFEEALPEFKGRWKLVGKREMVQDYGMINASGALVGEAGAAWPYRMINGIFEHLTAAFPDRLLLVSHTPVQAITRPRDDDRYPYAINTPRGVVHARHVFHCTEGHAAHLLPRLRGIVVPRRGQMTVQDAGRLIPSDRLRSWSLNMQNVFDYATVNARTGAVWIGGGEDRRKEHSLGIASDAELDPVALSHLAGVLAVAFAPGNRRGDCAGHSTVQASWTGILGHSIDHVPLVGMIPQELLDRPAGSSTSAEWIAAGYGGYGMVNAFLCGKALAMTMLGKPQAVGLPDVYVLTSSRACALRAALRRASTWKDHIQAML